MAVHCTSGVPYGRALHQWCTFWSCIAPVVYLMAVHCTSCLPYGRALHQWCTFWLCFAPVVYLMAMHCTSGVPSGRALHKWCTLCLCITSEVYPVNLFAAYDDYVSSSIFNPVRGGRLCVVFTTVHLRGIIIACLFGIKHRVVQ